MEIRIIFIIIFLLFSSCRNSKDENFTQNIKIEVANYTHEEYNRNVKRFVDSLHLNYKDSLDVIGYFSDSHPAISVITTQF